MAGLSSIARSYAVYFIISLHTVFFWHVQCDSEEIGKSYEEYDSGFEGNVPVIESKLGNIRGIARENYDMYLGIPYGKIDEKNPFGPSLAYPKFENDFDANNDSAVCPQFDPWDKKPTGSLDCLTLNVHVPKSGYNNLLPVLVFIHGGDFETGSGTKSIFGPRFFMPYQIVLVTLNYRLGVYGFMCMNKKIPGNQGLKDQLLAFQWIRDNIEAFGGDPKQVTLAGEGAGAVSVDLHLHSDQAANYTRFILQGGTILSPGNARILATEVHPSDEIHSLRLAKYMGWTQPRSINASADAFNTVLEFLDEQEPQKVVRAVYDLGLKFGLCIEDTYDGVFAFLTEDPTTEKWQTRRELKTQIIIGSNNDAGLDTHAGADMADLTAYFETAIDELMFPFAKDDIGDIFLNFYLGDEKLHSVNYLKRDVIEFRSDYDILHPMETSIKNYLTKGATVYRYLFSFNGNRNYMKYRLNMDFGGATNADELGYLFDAKMLEGRMSPEDQNMVTHMTAMWANFARNGDPTRAGDSALPPIKWPTVTADNMFYASLDNTITVENRPFYDRIAFWNMFYQYRKKRTV